MNHLKTYGFLTLLYVLISVFSLHAQSNANQEISEWYLEERFLSTDQNDDALLDESELYQFEEEFTYYLNGSNYDLTDKNKDGYLSYNEIKSRTRSEFIYRVNIERKTLRNIAREYPLLAQVNAKYLRKNPDLVERLFSNFTWLSEHSRLAETIYKDRSWTTQHPDVLIALHKNLRWMAANPSEARNIYRNRTTTQSLPELLGWRSSHKEFIRTHPTFTQFYELRFD